MNEAAASAPDPIDAPLVVADRLCRVSQRMPAPPYAPATAVRAGDLPPQLKNAVLFKLMCLDQSDEREGRRCAVHTSDAPCWM